MAQTTFANGRGIVHTQSGGKSTVPNDVCLTPQGDSIVPVAYTNTGDAKDTSQGPTTVTTDGRMPMVKGALYSKSTGDEPGTCGGVRSGTRMSVCEFKTYSTNVKFEGRGVCRVGDELFHNKKNTSG